MGGVDVELVCPADPGRPPPRFRSVATRIRPIKNQQRNAGEQPPPRRGEPVALFGIRRSGVRRLRRFVAGHLQAAEPRGQIGRLGAELVGLLVPGDLAAGEPLRDDVSVLGLVGDRRPERTGSAAELVPRRVHGPAHDERAVVGCPEDDRLVRCGECADPAARLQPAVGLVAGRQAQIALRAADGLILLQDLAADHVRARWPGCRRSCRR